MTLRYLRNFLPKATQEDMDELISLMNAEDEAVIWEDAH